jgi:hypothetical protein
VNSVKKACMEGGGTSDGCDCAVNYLQIHGYLSAGPDERQGIMLDATSACAHPTAATTPPTTVPLPTTTISPYTCDVTAGTPGGGDSASPGDEINFYIESTDRNAAITGNITISSTGSADTVVPLEADETDDGGRAHYTYVVNDSVISGSSILFVVTIGGATCSGGLFVN